MIKINYLISLIFVLVLSFLLGYASFSGSSPEAYLFPKIITTVMIFLSCLLFLTYFFQKNEKIFFQKKCHVCFYDGTGL